MQLIIFNTSLIVKVPARGPPQIFQDYHNESHSMMLLFVGSPRGTSVQFFPFAEPATSKDLLISKQII